MSGDTRTRLRQRGRAGAVALTGDGALAPPAPAAVRPPSEARGPYAPSLRPAADSWSWAAAESAARREAEAREARRALLLRAEEALGAVAQTLDAPGGAGFFAPLVDRLRAAARAPEDAPVPTPPDALAVLGTAYLALVCADLAAVVAETRAALADLGEEVAEVRGKVLGHEEARREEWRVQKARRRAAAKAEAAGARAGAEEA